MKQEMLAGIKANTVVIGLFVLGWHLVSAGGVMALPAPGEVLVAFWILVTAGDPLYAWTLQRFVLASLSIVMRGCVLAVVLAIPLGVLMGYSKVAERCLGLLVEVFRPIAPLAWIPIAYIMFANLQNPTIYVQTFIVFVGAIFPVITSTIVGVKSIKPVIIDAARTFGATPNQILWKVVLPAAIPHIIAGIRVGLGIGWMCIVAAEFVGGKKGIGFYIWSIYNIGGRGAEIVAGMMAIGLVGYLMNRGILWLEKKLTPWHS